MSRVHVSADELRIVRSILKRCLPQGYRTYAFGSRATGRRLKPWSDLDLAIEGPERLPSASEGALRTAFDEAPLDWKVDIVDLNGVGREFRRIVDAQKIPLS